MSYTVEKLITKAYYASGIIAREFETITGDEVNDGLEFLNDILGEMRVANNMLPYYTEHTFNSVSGQQTYSIDNLIEVETLVFFLNTVRYQMTQIPRTQYFGSPRAENIESLPLTYHVERKKGGADIYLYFLPNQAYPMTLWGLFDLGSVTLFQDLELIYDRFYITYLRYALAQRLCIEFDFEVPANLERKFLKLENQINKRSQQLDLRMTKISTLTNRSSLSYAQVNLGRGYTVPAGY